MQDPDALWYDIAYRFARQSKCQTRKVGCIIVTSDERMVGQGYNSAPKGSCCDDCPRCSGSTLPKPGESLEHALCAHAEANAIGYAARKGISVEGCTLYCTTRPCLECAKLIVAAGIARVVYFEGYVMRGDPVTGVFSKAGVEEYEYVPVP